MTQIITFYKVKVQQSAWEVTVYKGRIVIDCTLDFIAVPFPVPHYCAPLSPSVWYKIFRGEKPFSFIPCLQISLSLTSSRLFVPTKYMKKGRISWDRGTLKPCFSTKCIMQEFQCFMRCANIKHYYLKTILRVYIWYVYRNNELCCFRT